MFGFFKKEKKATGTNVGNYNSGDPKIEKMKEEFFKYFNKGEEADMMGGEDHYKKAYDVAKEWIKLEDTNRSYECLAAAAFKYGVLYPDNGKVKEARDIYAMLVKYSSDYQARLDIANDVLKKMMNFRIWSGGS